jgi:hypothetical protein
MTDLTSEQRLFLAADASLHSVVDKLTPADLEMQAPTEWTRGKETTLLRVINGHARDEAWVPDVLAGKTMDEVGDTWYGDLLGDDPIGNYDRIHDLATEAVKRPLAEGQIAHLSYGVFPVATFFEHTSFFRGFQAPSIAKFVGQPYSMPDDLVDMLWTTVEPQLDDLRAIHVFGPPVDVPEDSSREVQLLGMTGFYRE